MHAPTRQAAPRHTRILGFLCLSAALSSALAFVPVPSEQVNRESQIAEIRRFIGHKDAVWSVALAPDGQHALSGSYESLFLGRLGVRHLLVEKHAGTSQHPRAAATTCGPGSCTGRRASRARCHGYGPRCSVPRSSPGRRH